MSDYKIVHLHIPKTAGTALRGALLREGMNVLPIDSSFVYDAATFADVDVFSGHIGIRNVKSTPALCDRIVTILRDPRERALSYYYHLVRLHDEGSEISERTKIAAKYSLSQFLTVKDNPDLLSDLYNSVTWRLIYDVDLKARIDFRRDAPAMSEADLVARASENLASFLAVGFQDRLDAFGLKLKAAIGFAGSLKVENTNPVRGALDDLDAQGRRRLDGWIEMDMAVYDWARAHFA